MIRVLLVGNPNCGKTTLFNALTGENQRVGNWPGVTVEQKIGHFEYETQSIKLVDLPGLYSLSTSSQGSSIDEQISAQAVLDHPLDVIINVIDACQLERHLYLTSQLLELGKPLVLALNMMDIATQRGIEIDCQALSQVMGCPVVSMSAQHNVGVTELKQGMLTAHRLKTPMPVLLSLPDELQAVLSAIEHHLLSSGLHTVQQAYYRARRWLEGESLSTLPFASDVVLPDDADIMMADARYQAVHEVVVAVQNKKSDASNHLTARLDKLVLHRFWALPIFLTVMYVMFLFAINIGGVLQDFFDISSDAVFVQGIASVLSRLHAPGWLTALLANGVGKGINTTVTFIPVIASMFFFLALLETSGYMARAGFVVDRLMRALGLPGKSFVPMIVGFGCNVPAIMAARTLDSERDRLLTVLMSPFMSCSARLAIYAIFVATFFPVGGHNVVFSLYLIGIVMAVLTGLLLRKTVFHGTASPLLLELPAYHKPSGRRLVKEMSMRLRYFIFRAGKLIIPVCVVLGGLNAITLQGGMSTHGAAADSVLAVIGQWLTPIFSPMGLQQSNWPATMGLLTGMLAKEVVVGTLHTLYAQLGHLAQHSLTGYDFMSLIQMALCSIPQNILQLGQTVIHPLSALSLSNQALPSGVGEIMFRQFDGCVGAYAYLLFILLYIPCVSTMAVIRQEAGRRFMWFSVVWSLVLAYGVAVGFYQLATVFQHPLQTVLWVSGILMAMLLTVMSMRWLLGQSQRGNYVIASA